MRLFSFFLVIALSLAAIDGAQAQTPAQPAVGPTPFAAMMSGKVPDLSALHPLLGTWSCKRTKAPKGVGGIGGISTDTFALTLRNAWVLDSGTFPPTAMNPHGGTSQSYYGYDLVSKRWYWLGVDSSGGFDFATSSGPVNKTWTWTESTATADGMATWTATMTMLSPTRRTFRFIGPVDAKATRGEIDSVCSKT